MTGSVKPSAPQTPNSGALSAGQSYGDVQTAIGNTIMQNANEQNPYGSVNYTQTGAQQISIPIFNNQGAFQGMQQINVPQFNKSTTLTPAGQTLLNQQQQIGEGLNDLALSQTDRLQNVMGQPVSAAGLPARSGSLSGSAAQKGFGTAGDIIREIGPTNYENARSSVENAIMSRVNPQLDRDRAQLETKLVNQGLARGSEAFNQAMDESNRQANDARMQAVLAGGQEQSRLAELDLEKSKFTNAAQRQFYDDMMGRAQLWNQGTAQDFQQAQAAGQFQNENRAQALQEMLALRNQPINEITALLGGGQVNVPQFQNFTAGQIQQPQIASTAMMANQMANQNYQTQQSGINSLLGAVGGLGGAGLYGLGKKYGAFG